MAPPLQWGPGMTKAIAQILVTARANPSWSATRLIRLHAPSGTTHATDIADALTYGLLHWVQDTQRWVVGPSGYREAQATIEGHVLCACNEALIPSVGINLDTANPTWQDRDGVVHIFDGVCE